MKMNFRIKNILSALCDYPLKQYFMDESKMLIKIDAKNLYGKDSWDGMTFNGAQYFSREMAATESYFNETISNICEKVSIASDTDFNIKTYQNGPSKLFVTFTNSRQDLYLVMWVDRNCDSKRPTIEFTINSDKKIILHHTAG